MLSRVAPWFPHYVLPLVLWLALSPAHFASAQAGDEATQWAQKEPMALLTLMQQRCQDADPVRAVVGCMALADAMNASPDADPEQVGGVNGRLRDLLLELGRYAEAEVAARQALGAAAAWVGATSDLVAEQCDRLATALQHLGKLDEAEVLFRRALANREAVLGKEHPDVAASLNNLAWLLRARGKLDEAEPALRHALVIGAAARGNEHLLVATILQNLATLLQDRGKLDEAEPLFRRALASYEAVRDAEHPDVARSLNNLAGLLATRGKLDEAESHLRHALAIDMAALGKEHPAIATNLNNIARLLFFRRKLDEAEPLFRRALAIGEAALGKEHPTVASILNNLADLLSVARSQAEAELLYRRALAVREATLGKKHPDVATTLNNLALLLYRYGNREEAEPLYRRALDIYEATLGRQHVDVAVSLIDLAALALSRDKPAEALDFFRRAVEIRETVLRTSPTEDYARGLLQTWQAVQASVYGLPLVLGHTAEAVDLALRTALLNKSRTQDVGSVVNQALRSRLKTDEQRSKFARMEQLLAERAWLLDRPGGEEKRKQEQRLLWEAQRLNQELSVQLGVSSSQALPSLAGIREAVAATLPADAALVEVVLGGTQDYQARTPAERQASIQHRYIALLMCRGGQAEAVDLGTVDDVHTAVVPLLNGLRNPREAIQGTAHHAYQAVFAKLDELLKRRGIRQLIISPELVLQLLPWQALHDGTQYLVDRYAIRYVAAGRDLLRPAAAGPSQQAVVLANPEVSNPRVFQAEATAQTIAQQMRARFYAGKDATEQNLLRAVSPFTLLLATHGEYEALPMAVAARPASPPQTLLAYASPRGRLDRDLVVLGTPRSLVQGGPPLPDLSNIEEAMHRSQLLLQPGAEPQQANQNGKLTAEEALSLPLSGTQLVTMLACEGGLGALGIGQGVYGLRRAFLQAGAETVVSTLWRVEENSASELIRRYYDKLLKGKGRVEALDEAMKELRSDKEHPEYGHPYYWAPFVVQGQDGPLRLPAGIATVPQ